MLKDHEADLKQANLKFATQRLAKGHDKKYLMEDRYWANSNEDETLSLLSHQSASNCKNSEEYACKSRYFPILYFFFACITTFAALIVYNYERFGTIDLNTLAKIPSIVQLPFVRPYVFQLGNIFTTIFAVATYYSFYVYLKQKFSVPEYKNENKLLMLAYCVGLLSCLFYFLFAVLPSEEIETSVTTLIREENFFLIAYIVLSLVFNTSSLYFLQVLRKRSSSRVRDAFWINFKVAVYGVCLISSALYLTCLFLIDVSPSEFLTADSQEMNFLLKLYLVSSYSVLFMNQFYVKLFYFDLKYVSFELKAQPDQEYFFERKPYKIIMQGSKSCNDQFAAVHLTEI